jgi:thioredoxin reductase (NADPH)
MTEKECDLLVIGSGPAGMTSAIYAGRSGLSTLILESTAPGGQVLSTSEIENFPGFISVSGAELAMKLSEQVEHCGVETIYDEVSNVSLQGDKKTITCHETKITPKAIIIATGASPRKIGCEGEEKFLGAGIHFCALCDGAFYKDKNIIVAGGGNSAVEEVPTTYRKKRHCSQRLPKFHRIQITDRPTPKRFESLSRYKGRRSPWR